MTVLVALHDEKRKETWIGSDTQAVMGGIRHEVGPKWIVRGESAVGVTGDFRAQNVLQANAEKLFAGLGDVYEFTLRVRGLLEEDGFQRHEKIYPKGFGQVLLFARPSGVWSIGPDFSIADIPSGLVYAEGSGKEFALGAGYALSAVMHPMGPEHAVRTAIEAAIEWQETCGGRPWVRSLGGTRKEFVGVSG